MNLNIGGRASYYSLTEEVFVEPRVFASYKVNKKVAIAVLTEDDPIDAISVAKRLAAFAINPDFKSLTEANVKKMHEAGFMVYPWTVNEPDDIADMIAIGVDALITDFPERIE